MTIDASIPLQVKTPTVADMLNNAQGMQQLKTTDQAQQLTQNKLNGINAIGSINPDEYNTPEEAQKAQNSAMAQAGAANNIPQNKILNASATAEQAHALSSHYDTYNKGLKINQQVTGNLLNKEDLSPQDIGEQVQNGVKEGRIPQQKADLIMEQVAQTDGSTPALKKIVHDLYGQTLSLEQTTPQYQLRQVKDGYQHFQINPNATDPLTGKQGVQPISAVIPTSEVKTYTDQNGIQKTVPLSVYNNKVADASSGGGNGFQEGVAPGTASDIKLGTQQREENQVIANNEKPVFDNKIRARNYIIQNQGDPLLWGANTDFTQRVARLAAAFHVPYKDINDTASATDVLKKSYGIDPHASTFDAAIENIDNEIGRSASSIKKSEAQTYFEKNYGNDPEHQKEFNSAWNKIDPNVFVYKNKSNDKSRESFLKTLNVDQKKSLIKSIKFLADVGVN